MSLHKHGSMILVLGRMGDVCHVILYNNLNSCFCICITTAILYLKKYEWFNYYYGFSPSIVDTGISP